MKRLAIGIVLATLASFLWGLVYWGLNPLPYTTWKPVPDDQAAGRALKEQFPEDGTYYLPAMDNDPDTLARLYRSGPVAFVFMTAREGRPQHEPAVMVRGLVLYLAVCAVLAWLLRAAAPALPRYGGRVKLAALAGLAAALLIDLGDAVWWYLPWDWKLHQAFYDFTAFLIAGLVLAAFVAPRGAAESR